MKSLIKNYIDLLSIDKIKSFMSKNDINLDNNQLEYILEIIKKDWEDILINEDKYFKKLENIIPIIELNKIKTIFKYYKNRYRGYLF